MPLKCSGVFDNIFGAFRKILTRNLTCRKFVLTRGGVVHATAGGMDDIVVGDVLDILLY